VVREMGLEMEAMWDEKDDVSLGALIPYKDTV